MHDPGFGDDVIVRTDPATLVGWIGGRLALGHAQRDGRMAVIGPPWSLRMLAGWGRLSPFDDVPPAGAAVSR